jgi:endonuclease/exonuclease/phosphatase family metal-dependent hydrolase
MNRIRIATYNIHKCVGLDRRFSPERIADVLRELDADIIALQEVLCHTNPQNGRENQAEFLARELDMEFSLGENRLHKGGRYGNAVLTRLPLKETENFDISIEKREPRGCLRAEIEIDTTRSLHFFNLHMGTSFFERRRQVHKLLDENVLEQRKFAGSRIIAGDFNEWTNGLTTRLFKANFKTVDARLHLGKPRTFPGVLPMFHLDHIYFDESFRLKTAALHRSRKALVASDHLPIVAEFEF